MNFFGINHNDSPKKKIKKNIKIIQKSARKINFWKYKKIKKKQRFSLIENDKKAQQINFIKKIN